MKALLLIALPALSFAASAKPAEKKDLAEDKHLIAPQPVDWLKTYSLAPYTETWTVSLDVKDFDKALPALRKMMDKEGAALTQPLAQFPASGTPEKTQQLSYRLPEKAAKGAVKKLKKLGAETGPKITHIGELVNMAELDERLAQLSVERAAHVKELAAAPGILALTDSMIQHLETVKRVREGAASSLLLNMTIRERR